MPKIDCSVSTCMYNQAHYCTANAVEMDGVNSTITENTCCNTFTSKNGCCNASLSSSHEGTHLQEIKCHVNTCAYNASGRCGLNEIEVGSLKEAQINTETDCLSFETR